MNVQDWLPLLAVALPFLLALPAAFLGIAMKAAAGRVLAFAFLPAILLVMFAPQAIAGDPVASSLSWVPGLNLELAWRLDGFSIMFALIVAGIGFLVMFYAASYLGRGERAGRFYSYLLLFGGAMLGLVMTDNLVAIYAFWEITSICSFLLIGFWDSRNASQDGAVKALLVTALGGLALLAGLILTGITAGTWTLSELDFAALQQSEVFPAIVCLLLLAAFTKSAQLPFHLWLPTAMEAPTPVSAYLHSATMVKAGIMLMAKFNPLFAGTVYGDVTMYVGLLTMLFGGWLAMRQTDLKALLAYSTVSQLGLLTALLGAGDTFGMTVHLVNHAVFKASLFMVVGIIDHQTGSRDLRVLSGLIRVLPVTSVTGIIAAISMAGVPPMGGFISKELFIGNMLGQGPFALTIAVVGSAFTFAYTLRFARVFFGALRLPKPDEFKRAKAALVWPAVPLGLLVILFGVFPWQDTIASFFTRLTQAYFGFEAEPLTIWHGLTPALYLSMGGWAAGTVLFLFSSQIRRFQALITPRWNANTVYYALVRGLVELAERFTRATQGASFATHLRLILLAAAASGLILGTRYLPTQLTEIPWAMWVSVVFILVGVFGMILAISRITILVFMSAIGLGTTLLYVLFRAPDLALTQLLIETVTIILFLSGFRFLPRLKRYSRPRPVAFFDAAIGLGVGLSVTLLLLAVQTPVQERLKDFYLTFSKSLAGGDNVVNVMLVDFRGFDTMGEITVLTIVAVTIYALLRLRARPAGAPEPKSLEEENE